jgi:hypothetical protein
MTKQEIFDEPIWPSRLIFNAKLLFSKPYKDCDNDERLAIRMRILGINKNEIE